MEKISITKIIKEVQEEMCNDFCKYSDENEVNDDGTCGHFDDCPLNRLD
jgi:hypothetical protein